MRGEIEFRKEERQRAEGLVLNKSVVDDVLAKAASIDLQIARWSTPLATTRSPLSMIAGGSPISVRATARS